MRNPARWLAAVPFLLASMTGAAAPQGAAAPATQQPTFRVSVDLVTTDVIARDGQGQFISDLKSDEFEVYEDGVKQEIVSLVLTHGGRVFNVQAPPPAPVQEGIILPAARPTNDAAGRVFLIFIDDLHLDFRLTPRTRDLMQKMLRNLVHEGDMFGIVSTGTSSISEQLTYDRQVLESSIKKTTGSGLRPDDLIKTSQGSQGPAELRYRAHVAFSTAYQLMRNLENLRNRRKAVIYISSGYDFNPFATSRMKYEAEMFGDSTDNLDPFTNQRYQGQQFAEADLVRELAELTRAANRANATFYTIDPQGLVAGPDLDQEVETAEWQDHLRETQNSLRVLAEQTGGIAVVNQNDFDKALKRIDAETSDYYVLGYYSNNPDPLKRTRRIEVKTARGGVQVWSRTSYTLRATPAQ
ncbi:MAG: VWA domain-containing protein [Acidobacteria bacterium]|nr:VWA domain-containing protein [Acidobacteriota bacterium]